MLPFFAAGACILVSLILAAGCTGQKEEPVLNGTGWTLTTWYYNGTSHSALSGTPVTLDFGDDGRITGSAGCNRYFAAYGIQGQAITIGQAGSTMMYCGEPGIMEQESAYLKLLGDAKSYAIKGDQLTISDARGTGILLFTKTIKPTPKPLTGTNWTLESIHTKDAVSSVIADTTITAVFDTEGRVAGSAGCNRYFGMYNVTGQSLAIENIGSTRMACGMPGVMEQETTYLDLIRQTRGYQIEGNNLILVDQSGKEILTFVGPV